MPGMRSDLRRQVFNFITITKVSLDNSRTAGTQCIQFFSQPGDCVTALTVVQENMTTTLLQCLGNAGADASGCTADECVPYSGLCCITH